jgi:hypothetical protein
VLAVQVAQFEGGDHRLGRASLTLGGHVRLGAVRPPQFVGSTLCLGRGAPTLVASLNDGLRQGMLTSQSHCSTTPNAWRPRGKDRALGPRSPPLLSG